MRYLAKLPLRVMGLCTILVLTVAGSPATQPVRSLKELDSALSEKVEVLNKEYADHLAGARKNRLDGLRTLLDRAMEKKDLDTAIDLRGKVKAAEAELKSDQPSPGNAVAGLRRLLSNTTWTWGTGTVIFREDGTVFNDGWSQSGLVTSWKAINGHTAQMQVIHGRDSNRIAVLAFSPAVDTYAGTSFDGTDLPTNHQVAK